MADLGRADAEGERAHRAVRRGVAVPADDHHAGLAQPLLWADDMHDPLSFVAEVEQRHAAFLGVDRKVLDHRAAVRCVDRR